MCQHVRAARGVCGKCFSAQVCCETHDDDPSARRAFSRCSGAAGGNGRRVRRCCWRCDADGGRRVCVAGQAHKQSTDMTPRHPTDGPIHRHRQAGRAPPGRCRRCDERYRGHVASVVPRARYRCCCCFSFKCHHHMHHHAPRRRRQPYYCMHLQPLLHEQEQEQAGKEEGGRRRPRSDGSTCGRSRCRAWTPETLRGGVWNLRRWRWSRPWC